MQSLFHPHWHIIKWKIDICQTKVLPDWRLKIQNLSWAPRPLLQSFLQSCSIKSLSEAHIPTSVEFDSKTLARTPMYLTLISTWLKVLPLYTPTMDPTISGRMTMSLRWVFTTSGFSIGGASFLALRRRLRRDCCLRRRPRFSLLLWRAQYSCISCSLYIQHGDG